MKRFSAFPEKTKLAILDDDYYLNQ
jgi:hypothetical protein